MSDPIDLVKDSEKITRFIFSKNDFSKVNGKVKYRAFMPAPSSNQASVYRIDGYSEEEITSIDKQFVSGKRDKESKARADLQALQIRKIDLDIVSDPTPHIRHASIVGYKDDSYNRLKAMELARNATLILK